MKKYEFVEQTIIKKIKDGEFTINSLLPSEAKLMELCNVSRNVVRQALKNLLHKGITHSIQGVGTFVKMVPKDSSSSSIIGLITFFSHSYIFPNIIDGIDKILHPKGFHLLIGYSHHNKSREKALLHQFIQKGVAGIILEAVGDGSLSSTNYHTIQHIMERNIPVILIDNTIADIPVTSIVLNDYDSGVQSAMYFLQKGHRNYSIFYQNDYFPKIERMRGIKEYLESQKKDITINLFPFSGQGDESNALDVASKLIDSFNGEHLAIYCSSDEDAQYVIQKAKMRELHIGKDISIIGFDNFTPLGITTFNHPSIHMGKIAAREMLDIIEHPEETMPITMTLKAHFIERNSVKKVD